MGDQSYSLRDPHFKNKQLSNSRNVKKQPGGFQVKPQRRVFNGGSQIITVVVNQLCLPQLIQ